MDKRKNYQYYVEGDDEKCLINVLKRDLQCIASGKVEKFNAIQNRFTAARLRPLKQGTIVILVYDTDVEKTDTLQWNFQFLKGCKGIGKVLSIPQVKNLEDELIYACSIKSIAELTHSSSKTDYKRDLISCTNLDARLRKSNFDISKFWSRIPDNSFRIFGNDSEQIKL